MAASRYDRICTKNKLATPLSEISKDKKATRRGSPSREEQNEERRNTILKALYSCIREKGFSKSSLTDIALEAGMSPSHIRYYFDGKGAILESYLEQTCAQILDQIHSIDAADPNAWFKAFTEYFISNSWITPGRLSVMVEIFGLSVHDEALRRIKANYDEEIRAILEGFFERVGCAEGLTPADAAELAQALEAGLKYNAVFKASFDPVRAQKVFTAAVRDLAGAPILIDP